MSLQVQGFCHVGFWQLRFCAISKHGSQGCQISSWCWDLELQKQLFDLGFLDFGCLEFKRNEAKVLASLDLSLHFMNVLLPHTWSSHSGTCCAKDRGDKQLMVQCAGILIQLKAHSFAMFESGRYTGWNHETLMKLEMDLVCLSNCAALSRLLERLQTNAAGQCDQNPGRYMELSRASVALLFFDSVGIKFLLVCVFSISLFVVGLPFLLPTLKT